MVGPDTLDAALNKVANSDIYTAHMARFVIADLTDVGQRVVRDLRNVLFRHILGQSAAFFSRHAIGRLMSRITNDLFLLSELYHHGPEDFVIYSVKFIGAFLILLQIDAPLAIAVFLFVLVIPILLLNIRRFKREA